MSKEIEEKIRIVGALKELSSLGTFLLSYGTASKVSVSELVDYIDRRLSEMEPALQELDKTLNGA